jgi:CBS domain-containing protein
MAEFVREVMTPGVATVRPDASLVEAAQLMRAQDIGDVLVAADGHVIGVLTDRDITLRAVADGADPLTVSAQAVCTPNPVVIGPDDAVSAAVALMRDHAIRRLPVMEDGHPVGMVSLGDLAVSQDPGSALAHISRASPEPWPRTDRTAGTGPGADRSFATGPGTDRLSGAGPGADRLSDAGPGTDRLSDADRGPDQICGADPRTAPGSGSGSETDPGSGVGPGPVPA